MDTQSKEEEDQIPSTKKQFDLAQMLKKELLDLGVSEVRVDDHAYVYGTIPATTDKKVPSLGFIAHMDLSPTWTRLPIIPAAM